MVGGQRDVDPRECVEVVDAGEADEEPRRRLGAAPGGRGLADRVYLLMPEPEPEPPPPTPDPTPEPPPAPPPPQAGGCLALVKSFLTG